MRTTLKFPTGQQFQRMLQDDHEWHIITDTRLKILGAGRGEFRQISKENVKEDYIRLVQSRPSNKPLRVFDLHTHPRSRASVPSYGDMGAIIVDKLFALKDLGVNIVGHGVVTEKGIIIIKITGDTDKLIDLYEKFPKTYKQTTRDLVKKEFNQTTWEGAKREAVNRLTEKERMDLMTRMHKKAFRGMLEDEQDIKTRTVRRSIRGKRLRR
jgi:hypothetical protein